MANPFATPQPSAMDAMLPLMMMSQTQQAPKMAAPPTAPTGTPSTFKPTTGSFAGGAPVAPTQQQVGGKTLLGQ